MSFSMTAADLLDMLRAVGVTAALAGLGTLIAALLGLPLAVALRSGRQVLVAPVRVYVELMRGVPLLVLLFLLYYGGPSVGLRLPAATAGVIGLGLFGAGGFAEIYRAGLAAVPRGEIEAARMLGLSPRQILARVELPQALRLVLPPIAGQVITLVKESAVLSIITVAELTKVAGQISTMTFSTEPYIVAALLYWALVEIVSRLGQLSERRLARV